MGSFYRPGQGLCRKPGWAAWTLPCALDSAGFSAMVHWGGYPWTVSDHVDFVRTNGGRWELPIPWDWWAAMDYCCEQAIAPNRAEVRRRMDLTIQSAADTLDEVAMWWEEGDNTLSRPMLTLQGRTPADYLWSAGELARIWQARPMTESEEGEGRLEDSRELPPLLGIGSVCTRPLQGPEGLLPILDVLDRELPRYVQLHLFGVKGEAMRYLHLFGGRIASIDSMAWDSAARHDKSARYTTAHRAGHMARWYQAQLEQPRVGALQVGLF